MVRRRKKLRNNLTPQQTTRCFQGSHLRSRNVFLKLLPLHYPGGFMGISKKISLIYAEVHQIIKLHPIYMGRSRPVWERLNIWEFYPLLIGFSWPLPIFWPSWCPIAEWSGTSRSPYILTLWIPPTPSIFSLAVFMLVYRVLLLLASLAR